MNPLTLAKLFATLKNPTAEASMASALPLVEGLEEYKPTDLEMLAESGHLFDGDFVKSPSEYFFEDYALGPGGTLVAPFGGLETPDIPNNTYMNLTDDAIALLADNTKKWGTMPGIVPSVGEEPPFTDDPSVFKNARKMLEERLRRIDLGLPVPSEYSYPDDGLDDLPF